MPDSTPPIQDAQPPYHLTTHFSTLRDPRIARTQRHNFVDLILLTIISILCGADNFVEIERFAKAHHAWFQSFLKLPAGIPSHDTIARLFARLDPQTLSHTLSTWMEQVQKNLEEQNLQKNLEEQKRQGQPERPKDEKQSKNKKHPTDEEHPFSKVFPIDGKCLCDSFDRAAGQKALHLVSLYCSRYHLVLGQQKVDQKSNEQTAIEPLLEQIDITDAILTLDAMHAQKETTHLICNRGGHYVIGLKGNQGRLLQDVARFFELAEQHGYWTDDGEPLPHGKLRISNSDHGRYETREYVCAPAPHWLENFEKWAKLTSIIRVDRTRLIGDKCTTERSYYISDLPPLSNRLPHAIRTHWSIENSLHWILDVAYDEDHCRARKGHEAENLASIRRFTLALLKAEQTVKVGIKAKRKMAGWDNNYRDSLIQELYI